MKQQSFKQYLKENQIYFNSISSVLNNGKDLKKDDKKSDESDEKENTSAAEKADENEHECEKSNEVKPKSKYTLNRCNFPHWMQVVNVQND